MAFSSRFGDFPHYVPTGKIDDPDSLFTGWMLLSYRKPVVASSTMAAPDGQNFDTRNLTDENPRTFWVAAENKAGETLTMDLGQADTLRAVQVDFADYNSNVFADGPDIYTEFQLEASLDGQAWTPLAKTEDNPRRDRPNAYFELPQTGQGALCALCAWPCRRRKPCHLRYPRLRFGQRQGSIGAGRCYGGA